MYITLPIRIGFKCDRTHSSFKSLFKLCSEIGLESFNNILVCLTYNKYQVFDNNLKLIYTGIIDRSCLHNKITFGYFSRYQIIWIIQYSGIVQTGENKYLFNDFRFNPNVLLF